MQGFYFLVEFGLVLIYILKAYLRFYWEKICWIHYLHFSLETHISSYFSAENLETTPSIFLSKFSSEIYLARIINYWGSTARSVQLGLRSICNFFLSLFLFFSNFLSVFSLTDTNNSQDSREGRGNHYFSFLPLPAAHEHSFS